MREGGTFGTLPAPMPSSTTTTTPPADTGFDPLVFWYHHQRKILIFVGIVVVALLANIGMASFGIAVHFEANGQYSRPAHVVKAGKPSLRFAVAFPAGQDSLSDLTFTFVNGFPNLSGTKTK